MAGRPTKLTPELHKTIVGYARNGAYIETAAAAAGVAKQTLYNWLRWGAEPGGDPIYRAFAEDLHQAQAQDEMRGVLALEQIGGGGAQREKPCPSCGTAVKYTVPTNVQLNAITWKLERKFPDRYAGLIKIEHRIQTAVHEILEEAKPFMKPESYADFVQAVAQAMAAEDVAEAAAPDSSAPQDRH